VQLTQSAAAAVILACMLSELNWPEAYTHACQQGVALLQCHCHCRRFFLKRAPFSVAGGQLKLESVRPAYAVLDAFHHGTVDGYPSVSTIIAGGCGTWHTHWHSI
jgi:hypothetical protein